MASAVVDTDAGASAAIQQRAHCVTRNNLTKHTHITAKDHLARTQTLSKTTVHYCRHVYTRSRRVDLSTAFACCN